MEYYYGKIAIEEKFECFFLLGISVLFVHKIFISNQYFIKEKLYETEILVAVFARYVHVPYRYTRGACTCLLSSCCTPTLHANI